MNYRGLAALAAIVLLPVVATAQTVQPGMHLSGLLADTITSKTASVGQPVTLTGVRSTDGSIENATLRGRVVEVTRAGQGRTAGMQLAFDTLQLADGSSYAVAGEVEHFQASTANNGTKEAAGAVVGMIVGNILGKWMGTNLGGALGAAGGYVLAKNNREDVTIPAHATVDVHLVQPHEQQRQAPQSGLPPAPEQAPQPPQLPLEMAPATPLP